MSETLLEADARVTAEDELHRDKERLDFILRECLPICEWEEVDGFAKIEIKRFAGPHRSDIDEIMKERMRK